MNSIREEDKTWTLHTLSKYVNKSDSFVKKALADHKVPVYQMVGTYKLYDKRALAAVRHQIKLHDSPEYKAQVLQDKRAAIAKGRLVRSENAAKARKVKEEAKLAAKEGTSLITARMDKVAEDKYITDKELRAKVDEIHDMLTRIVRDLGLK